MRIRTLALAGLGALVLAAPASAAKAKADSKAASDSKALVKVYEAVAASIIETKNAEDAIVRALLEHHRDQALAALGRAAGDGGGAADLREAATHIGDFATEGGSSVEPIRNKLLAGGIHHNADDTGPDATYDEGYVVVTKKLKTEALDLAKRAGQAAEAASPSAQEATAIREAFSSVATRVLASK